MMKRRRKRNKEEESVVAMEKLNLRDDKKSLKSHSDHPPRVRKKKHKPISPRPGLNGSIKKKKKGIKKKAA